MQIIINIETSNAAFEDDRDQEINRIAKIAVQLMGQGGFEYNTEGSLYDTNGNRVGDVSLTGK